jgi:uncharacterized protein YkwD
VKWSVIHICTALLLAMICTAQAHAQEGASVSGAPSSYSVYLPEITAPGAAQPMPTILSAQEVIALVNVERAAAGCPAIAFAPELAAIAQEHALDMANNDFFGHTGSDGSTVGVRADRAGYQWTSIAENISAGYPTAGEAVAGWMASSKHRDNILDCSTRETGVGFVFVPDDGGTQTWRYYWTEVFGTR